MAETTDTRTHYRTRITLDFDAPLGDAVWQFATRADEKGVTVSQVVPVQRSPGDKPKA